jgi:hypothetical protein
MELAPVTAPPLQGRTGKRGRTLAVTGPNGDWSSAQPLARRPNPTMPSSRPPGGRWRLEPASRSVLSVLDSAGNAVATWRKGEVVLAGGETVPWEQRSLLRPRCRLGGDLWVAKRRRLRYRRFSAELSQAMLARDDLTLLTGIFSILTHRALIELGPRWWAGV